MKKSLRFASAALAVALAASCAAPAFAAGGSSFTKSETVYAVMNADGSIQSTTVSEHVYSASGLSKVTDQSTLTNIQNTESSAEFTQDGEKLVWNTDDTDVYYKGDTTRALPIQATVTYALDGQEAALEDLIGKSGHLTMTIALKNNETGTVNVNGTDRTIVTPLVTAVGVIFGQDATNVVAAHGLVESAAKSNVAAGREGFPVRSAAGRAGHHRGLSAGHHHGGSRCHRADLPAGDDGLRHQRCGSGH